MINVLVVSAETRLVDAVKSNLDGEARVRAARDAAAAQQLLFESSFGLVCLDYEAVKGQPPEMFIGIDNVLQKERSVGVLLVRKAAPAATQLKDQLESILTVIDLSRGRPQFDDKIRLLYGKAREAESVGLDDPSVSTDRILRHEVDLPALQAGSLVDLPLARLLYTLYQRKESGVLTLRYSTHELLFGFSEGELVESDDFEPTHELYGAFSWSHGKYEFEPREVSGSTTDVLSVIAEGCRSHIRQRGITEMMAPVMRRYPVRTNLWEDRKSQLSDYEILHRLMDSLDGSTNWETALSSLGQEVTDGFRAAYFAQQLDLVYTVEAAGFEGVTIQYSRAVRQARQKVDQAEVEKTKAYRAASSGEGRSELERELGGQLSRMRDMSVHEIFGVWEGCGRKVVQDRFYILVKEHHPDVYGGNTSGNVRSMAQDIFILIKDAYQKLLSVEKQQTAPPPDSEESELTDTGRERLDTPRHDAATRVTPSGRGRRQSTQGGSEPESEQKVDVKKKLSMLSGYRRKQRHRERLRSYTSEAEETTAPTTEEFKPPQSEEPAPQPQPEEPAAEEQPHAERQAKLDHLLRRAQSVDHPDAPNPSRDFWNKGYRAYKEGRNDDAFLHFQRAYDLEPESGPNLTFYAYTKFLQNSSALEECEELLDQALQTGNRQSAPDACLFMGHLKKAQGEMDEAVKFFQRALRLNPACREAEREIRLAEKRGLARAKSDPSSFIKNLFKK